MIIDAKDLILGRLASKAAKAALEGEDVVIVNCEDVILTGKKDDLLQKYKARRDRGHPFHGPFFPRMPDRMVRRTIRSMLPYKRERGKEALKRVKCFLGVPLEYQGKELLSFEDIHKKKLKTLDYLTLRRIAQYLGKDV